MAEVDNNPNEHLEANANQEENENNANDNENEEDEVEVDDVDFFFHERENYVPPPNTTLFYLHMTPCVIMFSIIWYSFRTHSQFYPTILHLTTSKMAFCVFGTSVGALCLQFFRWVTYVFLGDLRLTEREAIAEGMRWGLTETCLALTMFREEVSIKVGGMFVLLVGAKGWHWAVEMRGKHLGNTQEVFYLEGNSRIPRVRWSHIKFWVFSFLLYCLDIMAVHHCASECARDGPSVHILFGFEAAVLSVTAATTLGLYYLHSLDGFLNVMLQIQTINKDMATNEVNINQNEGDTPLIQNNQTEVTTLEQYSHEWKEKRGIFTLALDLLSQAAKFLCYLLFFFIVFTYYGMPINIFRELYVSYQRLRRKMTAFASYWRLSRDLDHKFETVHFKTKNEDDSNEDKNEQDENDEEETTCIICREQMTTGKKLPGCGHVFHAYCLKGWLMQQQTCPTCRSDISAAAARVERMERNNEENNPNDAAPNVEQGQEVTIEGVNENDAGQTNESHNGDDNVDTSQNSSDLINASLKSDSDACSSLSQKDSSDKNEMNAFPCLYRIESSTGAPVVSSVISEMPQKPIRIVPQNKIIICTGMKYFNENMFLQMPDGWVMENHVKRIVAVPFSIPDHLLNPKINEIALKDA